MYRRKKCSQWKIKKYTKTINCQYIDSLIIQHLSQNDDMVIDYILFFIEPLANLFKKSNKDQILIG